MTLKNRYPLTQISSAFKLLQGVTVFHHLVHICKGNEWRMAFNTSAGHYKYLVMPFGLTNALAVFQNLVNDVL